MTKKLVQIWCCFVAVISLLLLELSQYQLLFCFSGRELCLSFCCLSYYGWLVPIMFLHSIRYDF